MKGYMTTIRAGEIWLAKILFTDASASKKRPVLVLWLDGNDAVVAAVTSAAPRSMTDVGLADWKASGLRVASTVRLSRLDCLEQSLFMARIGMISSKDGQALQQIWSAYIKPQF
jgi:mRNA interferase MazF